MNSVPLVTDTIVPVPCPITKFRVTEHPEEDADVLVAKLEGSWADINGHSFSVRIKGKEMLCRQGTQTHELMLKNNRVFFGRWMRYFLFAVDKEAGVAKWRLAEGKEPTKQLGNGFEWVQDPERLALKEQRIALETKRQRSIAAHNIQAAAKDVNIQRFLQCSSNAAENEC